jgi:hypothetical protein
MKTRITIATCWVTFFALCSLVRAFPDLLPSVLPGIAMLVFRFFIPFASPRLRRVALASLVVANVLGLGFIAPGYFGFLCVFGAGVSALVCFVALVRSDILVFRRHEAAA